MAKNNRPNPVDIATQQRIQEQVEVETAFKRSISALRDFIAPSSLVFSNAYYQLGTRFARTFYVYGYPRQLYTGWLSPIINLDEVIDVSMFIYPVESQVLDDE
jgi:conjugal transfer ATP-binding protein TraC